MKTSSRWRKRSLVLAVGAAIGTGSGIASAVTSCESLATLAFPDTTITAAQTLPAGPTTIIGTTAPGTIAPIFGTFNGTIPVPICRVRGVIKPTSVSNIIFEAWMPVSGWNGKFEVVGDGGTAGSLGLNNMVTPVGKGYAVANTDTGHQSQTSSFALVSDELVEDFAHRGFHVTTQVGKQVVAAYYGTGPSRSYFVGCSTGGAEAMSEVQRYPDDFDGIVAGDPSWDQMRLYAARVWLNTFVNRTPAAVIPASKYPMIHNAVLERCDAVDGVKDGVIEDPTKCAFDFSTLTCSEADRADCLTKDQVETANAMTRPIRDPKSGAVLHPGRYYPGSELGWGGVAGPSPSGESHEGMRKIVFTPDWDYHTITVPDDVERAVRADKGLLYGGDPDVSRFFTRGGKLLMYHGWADPLVSPDTSVMMFKRINDTVGSSAANSLALFMVPGMGHCQGGPGTDVFDKVAALDQWVDTGKKPQSIEAAHMTAGIVDRTRPLCAYPTTAHYNGTGSTDDAKNFRCQ